MPFSRAPAPPSLENTESSTSSLVDVDSPHVSSVPSDYTSQSVKTDTQAQRMENEAEDVSRSAKEKFDQVSAETGKSFGKAKAGASKKGGQAKEKGKRAAVTLRENKDNPVVIANAVMIAGIGAVSGIGAYRKYTVGELSWKIVGMWSGAVGAFAVGDYFLSQ